ncbi:MAG: cation:proton antiporter, partial [Candidatus Spyradocola sp.]
GAAIMKAPSAVKKYLGPTLVPQAGVAIGLSLLAQTVVPEYADVIRAVVLCGTLIYELVGPLLSKIALSRAGEIASSAKKKPAAPAKA